MNFITFFKRIFAVILAAVFGIGAEAPAVIIIEKAEAVYVDGNLGSDSASGEKDDPLKTISKALEMMNGDKNTVYIIGGTFNEKVTADIDGITIEGAENSDATITAGRKIDGEWEKYKHNIYRIPVSENVESVFVNGEQMNLARWPNTSWKNLCHMKRAVTDKGTDKTVLYDSALPCGVDLTGAKLVIWSGSAWVPFSREITACDKGKSISWETPIKSSTDDNPEGTDCFVPKKNNYYYVCDSLSLLDTAGEWYYDSVDKMLYLYAPGGKYPADCDVSVKTQKTGLEITADNVTVKNINVFGCGVECYGNNCTLDNVNVKCADFFVNANYYDQDSHISTRLDGKNNVWKNSRISDTYGNGIYLCGEGNTVENCLIYNVCYAGGYFGGISENGVDNSIIKCTFGNSGRYHIYHNGKRIKILQCEFYGASLLSDDCGSTYTWGTNGEGSEIAYSYFHDNEEVAVYLDNNCSAYYIHDNVMIKNGTGITLNSQALNDRVENNIFLRNGKVSSTYCYDKDTPSMAGTVIRNNIYKGKWQLVEGENAPLFENNREVKFASSVKLPQREYGCDFV